MPFTIIETHKQQGNKPELVEKTLLYDFVQGEYTLGQKAWLTIESPEGERHTIVFTPVRLTDHYEAPPADWVNIVHPMSLKGYQALMRISRSRPGYEPKTKAWPQQTQLYLENSNNGTNCFWTGKEIHIRSSIGDTYTLKGIVVDLGKGFPPK